jgi:2-polyprenyl-3-methyl-5-hydroxy-6-metoxy-1,4-benzoquinol methylase
MSSPTSPLPLSHPFDRSGLAALSDLQTPDWHDLFSTLEKEQTEFLAKEKEFRSTEYKWPRDPLHTWSRVWEYPYAYHHFKTQRTRWLAAAQPRVVDVGSGVTFFPFSLARLGYHVTCADIDSVAQRDLARAASCIQHAPGVVGFRLCQGEALPFAAGKVDAVYCISVLEHIPTFEKTVADIFRILKPGGLFVLTFDLDLRGDSQIGPVRYRQLKHVLSQHFDLLCPEAIVHPADLLTSTDGPCPVRGPSGLARAWFLAKQKVKPLFGKPPVPAVPCHLCVEGLVLVRKQASSS